MHDPTRDPKYKAANATPFAFNAGDPVLKVTGDYKFRGVVLTSFRTRCGAPRYIVENDDGVIHILNHNQLRYDPANREPPSSDAVADALKAVETVINAADALRILNGHDSSLNLNSKFGATWWNKIADIERDLRALVQPRRHP